MSTTAPLPTPAAALRTFVDDYAAAVRRELDDLPAETVDDLTDGLEADLLDALSDTPVGFFRPDDGPRPGADLTDTVVAPPAGGAAASGAPDAGAAPSSDVPFTAATLTARFGTPAAYAAELRSSAGLAPRVAAQGAATRQGIAAAWAETRAGWAQRWRELRAAPGWKPVFEFLEVLRPVWWVGRAWVLATALLWFQESPVGLAPSSGAGWLLLVAAVVCSVQWGRGVWRFEPRLRWVGRALAVAAVVLLLPTTATALAGSSSGSGGPVTVYHDANRSNGVWVDGREAENLYVYGPDGKLVDGARVYDDTGKPVRALDDAQGIEGGGLVVSNDDGTEQWLALPSLDRAGRQAWNAYPVERVPLAQDEWGGTQYDDDGAPVLQPGAAPTAPVAPFDEVSPLTSRAALPEAQALPGDGTTPSPAPSDGASSAPSSDASPTPKPTTPTPPPAK